MYLQGELVFYVVSYAFVSATMLVSNKWAVKEFPYTQLVMLAQFVSSAGSVQLFKVCRIIAPTDEVNKIDKDKIIKFLPVVAWFYGAVMTNLAAMHYLSVDLMILIRTCCPFLVAFGDYVFLGRSLPSFKSWYSLTCLATVTFLVFVHEPMANAMGLFWGAVYYVVLSGSMVFTKKFINDVKLTTHDRVLWNNLLCVPPALLLGLFLGEVKEVMSPDKAKLGEHAVLAVASSCALGLAIAYAGWALRAKVSSLTFTLIGVLCKIGSITINAFFMEHLTMRSMVLIVLGILAATYYEEPKDRQEVKPREDILDELEKNVKDAGSAAGLSWGVDATRKELLGGSLIFVGVVVVGLFWDSMVPASWL